MERGTWAAAAARSALAASRAVHETYLRSGFGGLDGRHFRGPLVDIDALRIVANGVNQLRSEAHSVIVITHYQRLLNYLVPDYVHVMANGRIVKSGGRDLAVVTDEIAQHVVEEALLCLRRRGLLVRVEGGHHGRRGVGLALLSDFWPHGGVAARYGAFDESAGFARRATFVIDAEGVIRSSFATGPGKARPLSAYREALGRLAAR